MKARPNRDKTVIENMFGLFTAKYQSGYTIAKAKKKHAMINSATFKMLFKNLQKKLTRECNIG